MPYVVESCLGDPDTVVTVVSGHCGHCTPRWVRGLRDIAADVNRAAFGGLAL